jgi:hypothetical protein
MRKLGWMRLNNNATQQQCDSTTTGVDRGGAVKSLDAHRHKETSKQRLRIKRTDGFYFLRVKFGMCHRPLPECSLRVACLPVVSPCSFKR